uniref:Uncharacterized protein n=1 Tax=Anguilla anguilla TaxID=7936 RepID=A0A0E9WP06_ANGAN
MATKSSLCRQTVGAFQTVNSFSSELSTTNNYQIHQSVYKSHNAKRCALAQQSESFLQSFFFRLFVVALFT